MRLSGCDGSTRVTVRAIVIVLVNPLGSRTTVLASYGANIWNRGSAALVVVVVVPSLACNTVTPFCPATRLLLVPSGKKIRRVWSVGFKP